MIDNLLSLRFLKLVSIGGAGVGGGRGWGGCFEPLDGRKQPLAKRGLKEKQSKTNRATRLRRGKFSGRCTYFVHKFVI